MIQHYTSAQVYSSHSHFHVEINWNSDWSDIRLQVWSFVVNKMELSYESEDDEAQSPGCVYKTHKLLHTGDECVTVSEL